MGIEQRESAIILRALGRIEGKLESMATDQARVAVTAAATEARLAKLELHRASAMGWVAGASAVVATVVTFAWRIFGAIS